MGKMHPQKKAFLFKKTCPECKNEFTCSEYCGEKAAKEISRLVFYCETCTPIVVEREKQEKKTNEAKNIVLRAAYEEFKKTKEDPDIKKALL